MNGGILTEFNAFQIDRPLNDFVIIWIVGFRRQGDERRGEISSMTIRGGFDGLNGIGDSILSRIR